MSERVNSPLGVMLSNWLERIEHFHDPDLLAELKQFAADSPPPAKVDVIYQLLSDWQGAGLDIPQPGLSMLTFPADHGEHYNTPIEWRYFTLSLNLADGGVFSMIANLFRKAIGPSDTTLQTPPIERQIYSTSIAWVIQPAAGQPGTHHVIPNQTFWPGDGEVTMQNDPFRFVIGPVSIISDGTGADGDIFPLTIQVNDAGDPAAGRPALALDLHCQATNPLFYQGTYGYVGVPPARNGADKGTYYYSWHQQETTGTVTLDDTPLEVVSGTTWMDHQWGGGRPPTAPTAPAWSGWIWFEFQLNGGHSITCSSIHGPVIGGKLPARNKGFGTYVHVGESWPITCTVEVLDYAVSPATGVAYPCDWLIAVTNLVPPIDGGGPPLELEIRPTTVCRNQALWEAHCTEYSEAAAVVEARGVLGVGVVHLTGVGYCEGDAFEDPAVHDARCLALLRDWPDEG